MDNKTPDHFWPSYVDIMTTLFAIMLVLFVVSFCRFKITNGKLGVLVNEYKDIVDVYSTVSAIDSTKFFAYNDQYLKHLFTVDVEFQEKQYSMYKLKLDQTDKQAADKKRADVLKAGKIIKETIERVEKQQETIERVEKQQAGDNRKNNIKFLIVIEGQSSRVKFDDSDWQNNFTLSYLRAQFLDKFWKSNGIDLEAMPCCEIIISGSGERGVPRIDPNADDLHKKYPNTKDYQKHWIEEESRNQRFLINIVPVIGNIDVTKKKIDDVQ